MTAAGRLVVIGALAFASAAAAQERAEPRRARLRVGLGTTIHGNFLRRGDDGFGQLQAVGLKAPYLFGHVVAELDLRLAQGVRAGMAGGFAGRSAGREESVSGVAPREIESTWRRGYGEVFLVVGTGRELGPLWMEVGARVSVGGGLTTWRLGGARHTAPIVRSALAVEGVFLAHGEVGLTLRLGYALVRSGAMGPAQLYFDYSHLFFDVGLARTFG